MDYTSYERFREVMSDEDSYRDYAKIYRRRVQKNEREGIVLLIDFV
jgi:hypothetical protein